MSDNVCPLCGKIMRVQLGTFYENDFCHCKGTYTWTLPSVADLQSEIARLKSALEDAYRECRDLACKNDDALSEIARLKAELTNGQELLGYALAEADGLKAALEQANIERDEARRWARKLYRMGIKYQKISIGLSVLAIKSTAGILNEPNLLADEEENV